jgi:glutamate synthase domain-containing protein 1
MSKDFEEFCTRTFGFQLEDSKYVAEKVWLAQQEQIDRLKKSLEGQEKHALYWHNIVIENNRAFEKRRIDQLKSDNQWLTKVNKQLKESLAFYVEDQKVDK